MILHLEIYGSELDIEVGRLTELSVNLSQFTQKTALNLSFGSVIFSGDGGGQNGLDGITPHIGENGNWWIGEEDTGIAAQGKDGTDGIAGITPRISENGNWWIGEEDTGIAAQGIPGKKGATGERGIDGITPHIGENGNWWIGEEDTGIAAEGKDGTDGIAGITPHIGENGNWWIGEEDTGIAAQGKDGKDGKDGTAGITPHIGENGNWWIGEEDTGIAAQGKDGKDGKDGSDGITPHIGENGNWWIGEEDTGIKVEGIDCDDAIDKHNTVETAHEFIQGKIQEINENINGMETEINDKLDTIIDMLGNGGGNGATIVPKTITENGIYSTPSGVDGFNPVTVNVSPPNKYQWAIDIFNADIDPNKRMILVLSDSLPTFVFNNTQLGNVGCTWKTSDGATYNANATHTWNNAQDIDIDGIKYRWIMVYSSNETVACNVANATNRYAYFVFIGGTTTVSSLLFGSNANSANILLEEVLYDEQTVTFLNNAISASAFFVCNSFRKFKIPNTIKEILTNSFNGNNLLEEIILPNGVTNIANTAFANNNFCKIIKIPKTVTAFGTTPINNNASLIKIEIEDGWVLPGAINLSAATFFPETSAIDLFTKLGTTSVPITITFGSTLLNRWSEQTKTIATGKGYTLA